MLVIKIIVKNIAPQLLEIYWIHFGSMKMPEKDKNAGEKKSTIYSLFKKTHKEQGRGLNLTDAEYCISE